jgi:hypothetical protein
MKPLDRAIWIIGLAALVVTAVYWPSIKAAYNNRHTIATIADIANALEGK